MRPHVCMFIGHRRLQGPEVHARRVRAEGPAQGRACHPLIPRGHSASKPRENGGARWIVGRPAPGSGVSSRPAPLLGRLKAGPELQHVVPGG